MQVNNAEYIPKVLSVSKEKGKPVRIPLKGFSMNPWLVGGRDYALLTTEIGEIHVNDVLLSETAPGMYALHRVLHVDENRVQLLGDGNLTPDRILPRESIKARVVAVYRKGSEEPQYMDDKAYLRYVAIWMKLRPVRRWLLAFYRRILMPKQYKN